MFRQDRGLTWDDPYFILRSEPDGGYFFGQLAWPASYAMEFQKQNGLSFRIGPAATNALRVIAPGETITTPAVHLGHIKNDFDAAVQAMHEHIRRSVLPAGKPERLYLSQYSMPEDWPMTVYRGADFNETNLEKCMDVIAAVGLDVFLVEGPMWCSAYGNWLVPDPKRFPRGLGPLVEYAHKKGLLFGLYVEPEGGRDGLHQRRPRRHHGQVEREQGVQGTPRLVHRRGGHREPVDPGSRGLHGIRALSNSSSTTRLTCTCTTSMPPTRAGGENAPGWLPGVRVLAITMRFMVHSDASTPGIRI